MAVELMTANEDLILLHQSFESYEEVLTTLAGKAREQGLIGEEYLPAILAREKEFPTGLELPVPIAIPHIGDGCRRSFVSIATLDKPVKFYNMDCSGDELEVRIVFMFGILNPQSQIEILRKFATSFSDGEKISKLVEAGSEKELLDLLNGLLDGMLVIEKA